MLFPTYLILSPVLFSTPLPHLIHPIQAFTSATMKYGKQTLPDLPYTADQLFFIAWGQVGVDDNDSTQGSCC